ncbi:LrgB family protein [Ideonella livida]|uniref:Uncharacterized protein n=1 Tax=Ideonella livida TaxID=2707176 RepID=A0A7C9PJT9_9BURK|nr:LrgB family protein [Ideonella livida]NDY93469.1 hypothetical protein [Ideonella livida]
MTRPASGLGRPARARLAAAPPDLVVLARHCGGGGTRPAPGAASPCPAAGAAAAPPPTPEAEAFTLRLAAHAIGAARVAQRQPAQLGYAVAAMGLHGVATAVAAMLLAWAWG